MMETMPELQEIKSEIGGMEFGAHGGSNSTTPQPHQNFQWVSVRSETVEIYLVFTKLWSS